MELWVCLGTQYIGSLTLIPDIGYSYALYSSFSPGFQKYLEGLSAVHSAVAQAEGSRAAGRHVRRQEIETVHPGES